MVLEADPQVAAALERQAREPRGDHVPAQHCDRPGEIASLEHGEVRLQAGRGGREAEGHARSPEVALVPAEVELDECTARQPSRALERERDAQEARLEDGDARAEPVARAELDLVEDVAVGVDVDVVDGQGSPCSSAPPRFTEPGSTRPIRSTPASASSTSWA